MRHVELTELTKLVREEEEYSTLRDQQYTFQMFLNDCESWIRVDLWTKEVRQCCESSHHVMPWIDLSPLFSLFLYVCLAMGPLCVCHDINVCFCK